jgi:hypothetical protein
MRAKDIHCACEDELGRPVSWSAITPDALPPTPAARRGSHTRWESRTSARDGADEVADREPDPRTDRADDRYLQPGPEERHSRHLAFGYAEREEGSEGADETDDQGCSDRKHQVRPEWDDCGAEIGEADDECISESGAAAVG